MIRLANAALRPWRQKLIGLIQDEAVLAFLLRQPFDDMHVSPAAFEGLSDSVPPEMFFQSSADEV